MAFGPNIGLRIGPRIGPRIGLVGDTAAVDPLAGVTQDPTNLKRYPANDAEWSILMTVAGLATGNPANIWTLQGAGNAADTGTPGGCTLTNTFGSPQSPVTGATRLGYTNADGGTSKKLLGTTGAPNPGTTSTMLLAYIDFGIAPGGTRDLMGVQTGATINYLQTTGKLRIVAGAAVDSASSYNGTQHWVAMRCNITASTITLLTGLEALAGTYVLPNSGSAIWFGGHTALCSAAVYAYGAEFRGTAAELSNAQVKTLLQTLGETVVW